MATNKTGVAINIRAFLPTGTGIDENFMALAMVKDARDTGDYSKVLAASTIDEIAFKQVNRRVPDAAAPATTTEALLEADPAAVPADDDGAAAPAAADAEEEPKRRGKAA
jgi:hypothetical protein